MDLGMGGGGMGGGGIGGCRSSVTCVFSTVTLSLEIVIRPLGGSETETGAGPGTEAGAGAIEGEGAEWHPALLGSLLVMVTMETAGITGGENSG